VVSVKARRSMRGFLGDYEISVVSANRKKVAKAALGATGYRRASSSIETSESPAFGWRLGSRPRIVRASHFPS
jgi:hypothetical protein